jgi:biopolymer transport protein ExbB
MRTVLSLARTACRIACRSLPFATGCCAAAMLCGPVQAAPTEPGPLEAAYQREYAYLQAEVEALQTQRRSLQNERDSLVAEGERELANTQAEVLALTARRTALEESLASLERGLASSREGVDRVENTLVQAAASVPDVTLPEGTDPATQARAFEIALAGADARLAAAQGITVEPGTWFGIDGTKRTGDIRRIGRIAAIGVGDGPLAPAGEGRLVRVVGDGTFLFEGLTKRATPEKEKTWTDQLRAGGVVGAVILALGAAGLVLAILRLLSLGIAARGRGEAKRLLARLEAHGPEAALQHARKAPGAAPRVIQAVLDGPASPQALEDRASEAILNETPAIERFGVAILVIAAVAPLLGLLGTVTGMIGTFEILTEFGTGDPRMLSGGISEALVTTQLGLIVAIPMLLIGNLLNRAGENLLGTLESAALGVINRLPAPGQQDPEDHRLAAK